jgi:hypothetical protein
VPQPHTHGATTQDQPTVGKKTNMLGVAPLAGRKVNAFPWGIHTQPYWLVKTHCPAGATCWTTTSAPDVASISVGGGGSQVGAGSVGWTGWGAKSVATATTGSSENDANSATTRREVFMASPCRPRRGVPGFSSFYS